MSGQAPGGRQVPGGETLRCTELSECSNRWDNGSNFRKLAPRVDDPGDPLCQNFPQYY